MLFNFSKELNEIVYSDELKEFDTPVKFLGDDGKEYHIHGVELEEIEETGEQVVWLQGTAEN